MDSKERKDTKRGRLRRVSRKGKGRAGKKSAADRGADHAGTFKAVRKVRADKLKVGKVVQVKGRRGSIVMIEGNEKYSLAVIKHGSD